jgi:hypothetical protein
MAQPAVFISYSHKDEAWKDRLVSHLRVLEYEGELDVWDDRRIEAGDDWRREIETALDNATVAILIISKDFLTSPFIREQELTKILDGRKQGRLKVIPLIAEPCAWQQVGVLQGIQARPRDGRPLSAAASHQVDEDLAALAVEIVKGTNETRGGVVPVLTRRMTARAWLMTTLLISGIAATVLTYAAYHWHLDTDVRLDLTTERLSFAGRGTQPQLLDLGIQFSRLTFAGCGSAEFEGMALKASGDGASPARLICRDADAKIALEATAADSRLGALSAMTVAPGTHLTLSVAGSVNPVIRLERSGPAFTLDVPIEHDLDVVTNFVDTEPPAAGSARLQALVRYAATIDEVAPRHAIRLASGNRGAVDLVATLAPGGSPPSLQAPISVDAPAITKESAAGYATTALVAPGSLAYVDYPSIPALHISEDTAIALTAMSATQVRALTVVSTTPLDVRKSRYAFKVTVEGRLESARVGRGDPGVSEKTNAGRWRDPRLTVYDVVTTGWLKLAALAASWTVATIASAYLGWKKLSSISSGD